jgi:hypothetical protein
MSLIDRQFNLAQAYIDDAISELGEAQEQYRVSGLPFEVVKARLAALDGKIDYLKGLLLNPQAHPWVEDYRR